MAETMRTFRSLAVLLALLIFPPTVFAHRLDEYLQATLVTIEPGEVRLQMNLTPGVSVAEQVLGLIDRDHNGMISTNETAAYAELLKRDLTVRLDGRRLAIKVVTSEIPPISELRSGEGIIQIEFSAAPVQLTAGAHTLACENRHQTRSSVYLLNAAPSKSAKVQITRQKRNDNQSAGEIEFTFHPPAKSSDATPTPHQFREAAVFADRVRVIAKVADDLNQPLLFRRTAQSAT
jgi:hypothetical protein